MSTNETTKTYNGWTNYETWNVVLWMDNDEGTQRHFESMAQECADEAEGDDIDSRKEEAEGALADRLKDYYAEAWETQAKDSGLLSSVWTDLVGAALSEVNWREIAENMLNDFDSDEDDEDDEDSETE